MLFFFLIRGNESGEGDLMGLGIKADNDACKIPEEIVFMYGKMEARKYKEKSK